MKIFKSLLITLLLTGIGVSTTVAQSYYDDDIYYDASKDVKKKEKTPKQKQTVNKQEPQTQSQYQFVTTTDGSVYVVDKQGNAYPVNPEDIPGSDTYQVYTDNTRDVDEYNRRYREAESVSVDSLNRDSFTYTRDIERFSNPTIVSESNDQDLINYYAETQPAQINIFVDTPSIYSWNYLSPYYRPYSYWTSWSWDPWYGYGWYDPYWSWSWSWGPSWGWGWHHNWYPGWHHHCWHDHGWHHGHSHYYRPVSPGAHRPVYSTGNGSRRHNDSYRGNYNRRPTVNGNSQGGYRGNGGRRPSTVGNVNSLEGIRPAVNYNKGRRPSSNGNRNQGINNSSGSHNSGRGNAIRNNNNNNNNSSRPSVPSYRSSSGGNRGGFNSGGSFGGGGRSSGGGGRGGRR